MAKDVTVVTYDVSEALTKLRELDTKVAGSGKKAEQSLNKGAAGAKSFEGALGRVNPKAGALVGKVTALAGAFGPFGVVVAGAGAAVGALVSQLVNLPELLKDSNREIEALRKGTKDTQAFEDLASSIQDARVNREFEEKKRQLNARGAALIEEQNITDVAKEQTRERLAIHKAEMDELVSQQKDSADRRKTVEEQLNEALGKRAVDQRGRQPIGRQVIGAVDAAAKARRGGDLEKAQRILDEARELAQAAGGHAFFGRKVEDENDRLIASLRKRAAAEKQNEDAISQTIAVSKEAVDQDKERLAVLNSLALKQTRDLRAVGGERKELRNQAKFALDQQAADQAARDVSTAAKNLEISTTRSRTNWEKIKTLAAFVGATAATSGQEVASQSTRLGDLQRRAVEASKKVTDPEATTQDVLQAVQQLQSVRADLSAQLSEASFPKKTLDFNVKRLEEVLATIERTAGPAAVAAGAAGATPTQAIRAGGAELIDRSKEEGEVLDENNRKMERFLELLNQSAAVGPAVSPLPSTAAPASQVIAGQAPAAAAAPPPGAVASSVTVNATVKGGIIDRETTEQIVDIIKREMRRGTSEGTA